MTLRGICRVGIGVLLLVIVLAAVAQCIPRISPRDGWSGGKRLRDRQSCHHRVTVIGRAIWSYYQDHARFPQTVCLGEKAGQPYSWRVLLLPYLEKEDGKMFAGATRVFEEYDFYQSWNSERNLNLARSARNYFMCPVHDRGRVNTSYLAVVGERSAWSRAQAGEYAGLKEKVIVMEVKESGVHWMDPRDLSTEEALERITDGDDENRKKGTSQGFHVLYFDAFAEYVMPHVRTPDEWRNQISVP